MKVSKKGEARRQQHAGDAWRGGGLGQVEGQEVVAELDALVEDLKVLDLQELSQVGLAERDEGEGGGRAYVGVEPVAPLVQQAMAEQVVYSPGILIRQGSRQAGR